MAILANLFVHLLLFIVVLWPLFMLSKKWFHKSLRKNMLQGNIGTDVSKWKLVQMMLFRMFAICSVPFIVLMIGNPYLLGMLLVGYMILIPVFVYSYYQTSSHASAAIKFPEKIFQKSNVKDPDPLIDAIKKKTLFERLAQFSGIAWIALAIISSIITKSEGI